MPYPRENILRKTVVGEANKAVVCDIGQPGANMRWKLILALWGYSAAPAAGLLTIEDGNDIVEGVEVPYTVPIIAGGPGEQQLGWQSAANIDTKATLAAGGGAIVGRITLVYTID